MPELFWLLLPIAAASGWYIARFTSPAKKKHTIPGDYLRGLNYLLNEQPDKALEVFINYVDVDSETVETHLILGNMFRRRGEVDRAIRVHQNLIARPNLNQEYRSTALLELGKDYLKAGLLDRAESLLIEAIESKWLVPEAYPLLAGLYEQEKEWQKAIEVLQKAPSKFGKEQNQRAAHYYCELAQKLLEKPAPGLDPKKIAKKALAQDKHCIRASILLGDIAMKENDYKSAVKLYSAVYKQKPELFGLVISKLRDAYAKLNNKSGFTSYLESLISSDQKMIVLEELLNSGDVTAERKQQILHSVLTDKSINLPIIKAYLVSLIEGGNRIDTAEIQSVIQGIDSFLTHQPSHRCSQCGFHARAFYWQCPGCHYWGTITPLVNTIH